jgi:hypothetical protein
MSQTERVAPITSTEQAMHSHAFVKQQVLPRVHPPFYFAILNALISQPSINQESHRIRLQPHNIRLPEQQPPVRPNSNYLTFNVEFVPTAEFSDVQQFYLYISRGLLPDFSSYLKLFLHMYTLSPGDTNVMFETVNREDPRIGLLRGWMNDTLFIDQQVSNQYAMLPQMTIISDWGVSSTNPNMATITIEH